MGKLLNTADISEHYEVDERTVYRWRKEGLPWDGGADSLVLHEWLRERDIARRFSDAASGEALDYTAERARLAKEQADKTAMENEQRRLFLADVRQVAQRWAAVGVNVKTRLLAIPVKAAPLVLRCKTIAEVHEALTELIHEALADISGSPPGLPAGNGVLQRNNPSREVDSKPVGRQEPKTKPRGKRRAGKVGH